MIILYLIILHPLGYHIMRRQLTLHLVYEVRIDWLLFEYEHVDRLSRVIELDHCKLNGCHMTLHIQVVYIFTFCH